VDGSALLTCKASGEPAPDIVFHKDSKPEPFTHGSQRDTRIFTDQRKDGSMTTAQLKIDNLLRTDDGLYNCIASNTKIKSKSKMRKVYADTHNMCIIFFSFVSRGLVEFIIIYISFPVFIYV
jgi:hypothetical protein